MHPLSVVVSVEINGRNWWTDNIKEIYGLVLRCFQAIKQCSKWSEIWEVYCAVGMAVHAYCHILVLLTIQNFDWIFMEYLLLATTYSYSTFTVLHTLQITTACSWSAQSASLYIPTACSSLWRWGFPLLVLFSTTLVLAGWQWLLVLVW
jgi:hypothetical protein